MRSKRTVRPIQSSLISVLTSLQLSLGYYKGSLHQTEKNTPVKHRILHAGDPVRTTIAAAGAETTDLSNPVFCYTINHTHHSTGYVMTAANYQAATTGAGQSLSQTERFNSERTDCGPSVNPSAGSFLQDPMPLLTNYDSMKMSNNIDQFWYVEKLTTLTQLYLELRLPLHDALRAAEADL
jgi:hypothetical protein